MLKNLRSRMNDILDPVSETFNPLPASASLLDPTITKLLLVPDMAGMLHSAKRYIIGECRANQKHPLWGQTYRAEIHWLWNVSDSYPLSWVHWLTIKRQHLASATPLKQCRDSWSATLLKSNSQLQMMLWPSGRLEGLLTATGTTRGRPDDCPCLTGLCWANLFFVWPADNRTTQPDLQVTRNASSPKAEQKRANYCLLDEILVRLNLIIRVTLLWSGILNLTLNVI